MDTDAVGPVLGAALTASETTAEVTKVESSHNS